VRDAGLTQQRSVRVRTRGGVIEPRLEDDGRVTVDMGPPVLEPARVPFEADGLVPRAEAADLLWPLALPGGTRWISAVSMGNPHAVQVVDDVDAAPVATEGPLVEAHPRFPRRVNAGFMQVVSRSRVRLRVYERGVGETLACGSGACAAVVAGIRRGLLDARVDVDTRGGLLSIEWHGGPVLMTGPAQSVFTGEIDLDTAFPTAA
jgi:diaminopimelate epimerase